MPCKRLLFLITSILCSSILLSSCSDSDERVDDVVPFKLVLSKSVVQPFETIMVSVDIDSDVLVNLYDSIVWQGNGVSGPAFFRQDFGYGTELFSDYRFEGKHKIYASAYKNGILIDKDSVEYQMKKPDNDFFVIDWGKEQASRWIYYTTGLTPSNQIFDEAHNYKGIKGVELILKYEAGNNSNDTEYATMSFGYWSSNILRSKAVEVDIPNVNEFEWISVEKTDEAAANYEKNYKREYDFFYAYLTALYGVPNFDVDADNNLLEEYNKRFSFKREHYYPVQIWDTPTSCVSILKYGDVVDGITYNGYPIVVAQPRR